MLTKIIKPYSRKMGLPPGAMMHVGEAQPFQTEVAVIDYDEKDVHARTLGDIEEAFAFRDTDTISWINVSGLHDTSILESIGRHYGIHPLTIEDALNTGQRLKAEFFDNYVFVVLKMLRYEDGKKNLDIEQVSLILGPKYVITFQERPGDVLDSLRDRILKNKGRVRREGADYLAYCIMDVIVDHYFAVLEQMGEEVESLEERILAAPGPAVVSELHRLRRELIFARRATWPLREEVSMLIREEHPLIHGTTAPYLRDLYDHTILAIDTIETFRDMVAGLLDVYLSSLSNRMNEVMKVLTIIATIFIPLTFMVGIYGMNFEHMPELSLRYGYPAVLLACLAAAGGMLVFFKRRKWL